MIGLRGITGRCALAALLTGATACSQGRVENVASARAGIGGAGSSPAAGAPAAGGAGAGRSGVGGAGDFAALNSDAGRDGGPRPIAGEAADSADAGSADLDASHDGGRLVAQEGLAVRIVSGKIEGKLVGATREFLGVPYAEPPIGALRFAPPRPVSPWLGARDASRFGHSCVQSGGLYTDISEDCLTLNVFAPNSARPSPRPVMVFIHGGAFFAGGSSTYDAAPLSQAGDVVVVTINYRLGALGFFAHPALCDAGEPCSNQGMRDQQLALRWVGDNIAAFGGDPSNVTVFGESAGSVSACAHMLAKGSEGLGHRFILESGSCAYGPLALQPEAAARAAGATLIRTVCSDAPDPIVCLRAVPAERLVAVAIDTIDPVVDGYWPWVDGEMFDDTPERLVESSRLARAPMIVGTNQREWALWIALGATPAPFGSAALRREIERYFPAHAERLASHYAPASELAAGETFQRMMTDAYFRCPTRALVRAASAAGNPVYLYDFDVPPAAHSLEIDYVFGVSAVSKLFPFEAPDPPLPKVVSAVQQYWTVFAAHGDPNVGGREPWPRHARESDRHLRIAEPLEVRGELARAACDLWDELWAGTDASVK